MNKMKKITATAAAMAISAGLAVGGTLAYLNSVTETNLGAVFCWIHSAEVYWGINLARGYVLT